MNVDELLMSERKNLQEEQLRLGACIKPLYDSTNKSRDAKNGKVCPAELLLQSQNFPECKRLQKHPHTTNNNANIVELERECVEPSSPRNSSNNTQQSSLATKNEISINEGIEEYSALKTDETTFRLDTIGEPVMDNDKAVATTAMQPVDFELDLSGLGCNEDGSDPLYKKGNSIERNFSNAHTGLEKYTKNMVNQQESMAQSARMYKEDCKQYYESNTRPLSGNSRLRKKDDMEQWVTDTFYSYFPGFNNENQKRQRYLRERQRENQQNFLKHQMLNPPLKHVNIDVQKTKQSELNTARSAASTTTSNTNTTSSTNDKTELEIIVNNPNYVAPAKSHARNSSNNRQQVGATRHKLLQDLGHVELSNIVTGDGIMERNMRSAELETARKKDYQRDLMQQIEEKRRTIELLREKERKQEEALTRRLEAQLKTMHLEEQLEKERMLAEKVRIDSENNRLMREHLLAKLENDKKLLNVKQEPHAQKLHQTQSKSDKLISTKAKTNNANVGPNNDALNHDDNRVYKYFSNSARHEYKRGLPLPEDVDLLEFDIPALSKTERECFHLCEKICPLCDEPLKSYESCCLRCQRKLALKMKTKERNSTTAGEDTQTMEGDEYANGDNDNEEDVCQTTYALVCLKCERLYALCPVCIAKSDVCRACHNKRNVCLNCRRTLCAFCLEEIACGKDTERIHVNDNVEHTKQLNTNKISGDAFHVLEVNYSPSQKNLTNVDVSATLSPTPSSPYDKSIGVTKTIHNKLINENKSDAAATIHDVSREYIPYSVNISNNSVFHDEYKIPPNKVSRVFEVLPNTTLWQKSSHDLDSSGTDEQASIERVRRETDKRLSRYLKNYGDLATHQQRSKSESRNRSTQTTPLSSGRRDVVMHETTHNLSMPLLREMPKMTRNESINLMAHVALNNQRKIDNLKSRWEVPFVQKSTISSTSPKILTQVGAIRKQLQSERFHDDEHY